jgi:hypothetical protein
VVEFLLDEPRMKTPGQNQAPFVRNTALHPTPVELAACPPVSRNGSRTSISFVTVLGLSIALLAGVGCQHLHDNEREFRAGSERGIDDARVYAVSRLKKLSAADLQTIAETRPAISHVDYTRVHYRWTNVCTVLATPPPCQPYMVMDQRKSP